MRCNSSKSKSPLLYFLLVFILSIPFWLLGTIWERFLPKAVSINLPFAALMFVCPGIAASILLYREQGWDGVKQLLGRSFDYPRINKTIWYVPILCLMPLLMLLEYGLLKLMGVAVPNFQVPVLLVPVLFAGFFIAALGEELGWSGYAIDPLQERWGALWAGIMVGTIWAIVHIVPYLQAHNSPAWVAWQCAFTVGHRILLVWIYNNTGKSVFAASLAHAMSNVSFLVLLPVYGSFYNPFITFLLVAVTAAIVVFLWGSRTLARYRYA